MRRAFALILFGAFAASEAAMAQAVKCIPRSVSVTMRQGGGQSVERNTFHYNELKGSPSSGVRLCAGVEYRLVPKQRCLVRLPETAGSQAEAERLIQARARAINCPAPKLLTASQGSWQPGGDGKVRIVPSGEINLRVRREVVLIVPGKEPDDEGGRRCPSISDCPIVVGPVTGVVVPDLGPPAPSEESPVPPAVAGAVGGAGGILALQQLFRRRRSDDEEEQPAARPTAANAGAGHGWQVRARPDLPAVDAS